MMPEPDALGIAALAYYFQATGAPVTIRLQSDSDRPDQEPDQEPMALYFSEASEPASEVHAVLRDIQHAFPPPRRVLDIGCLAGRFLLHFQQRGYEAVGVDISPGAVWVAQQRGAVNVRQQDVWTSTPADLGGPFDITLLLGHNIGLGGTPHGVRRLLQVASALTELGGVVVINSIDKERVAQDWARTHVQHSVAHGRHPGQTRYRINVGPYAGPWFDWIHVSPEDVAALAAPVGWTMVATYTREHTPGYWAGVLQKVTP